MGPIDAANQALIQIEAQYGTLAAVAVAVLGLTVVYKVVYWVTRMVAGDGGR